MEDIEWAAGLYVGEGSCFTQKQGKYLIPTIQIQMVDKEALEKFRAIVKEGNIYGPFTRNPDHQPMYHYKCRSVSGVTNIIRAIYDHLNVEKRNQIDRAMNIYYDGDWWF